MQTWLKENVWNILITGISIVTTFTLINYRLSLVEAKVASYPSQDYFELRFETIDNSIKELKDGVEKIND